LTRYAKVIAAANPVAYWRFDMADAGSPAVDAVGSFDGTCEDNAGAGTFTFGVPTGIPHETNTAIAVTGGAWVTVPYALELNPYGPFSAEVWVKPSSLTANGNDYRSAFGSIGNGVGGPTGWHVYQIPGDQWVMVLWGDNWINTWFYDTADAIVANNWYHLVVAYDGNLFKFYVNGALRASAPWSGFVQNANGAMVFGWRTDKGWVPFTGAIDDPAFYNRELTPDEVISHYYATVKLTITEVGNKVVLSWPEGTLQQATAVGGTYTDLTGVTSPYTNSPAGSANFFRVKAYSLP
jgi:hypothetical protein